MGNQLKFKSTAGQRTVHTHSHRAALS